MSSKKNLAVTFLKLFLISLFVVIFFMGFFETCSPEKGDTDLKPVYDEKGNYLGDEKRTFDGENWIDSGIVVYHNVVNDADVDEQGNHVKTQTEENKKYKWDKNKGKYVLVENTMNKVTYQPNGSIKVEDYNWDNNKGEYTLTSTEVLPTTKKERKPTHALNLYTGRSKEPATNNEIKDTKSGTGKAENSGGNTGAGGTNSGSGGGGGAGGGGGHP
jgi:uncharacterized membrane protein YgcG